MPSEKTRGSGSSHATRVKKGDGGGEDEVGMVKEEEEE